MQSRGRQNKSEGKWTAPQSYGEQQRSSSGVGSGATDVFPLLGSVFNEKQNSGSDQTSRNNVILTSKDRSGFNMGVSNDFESSELDENQLVEELAALSPPLVRQIILAG